jgi:hypothetical protein
LRFPRCAGPTLTVHDSPNNDVLLETIKGSPILAAGGFQNEFERSGNPIPTMEEWTFAKQKWQRKKNIPLDDVEHRTAQILPGFKEQVYA